LPDSDYYDILGVGRDSDLSAIKKAYRRAAVQHHPDKNPGDPAAEEKFKSAAEAYAVLSDPAKRQLYDRFGKAGLGAQGGGAGFDQEIFADFSDVLGDLFGFGSVFGGGGRARRRGTTGRDLRYDLEIEFEEAVLGLDTQIRVPRLEACDACDGSGAKPDGIDTCAQCGGRGQVAYQQGFFTISRPCGECRGAGRRIVDPCDSCSGNGRVRAERTLQVKIPAGVDDGTRLRMGGQGEAGRGGGHAGDLYVVLHVREHRFFQRDDCDILCEMPVTFAQAALGTELRVPTLDGETTLTVPSGTQSGSRFRIKGLGVPALNGRGRGDQYVIVQLRTPKRLSGEQRELLERLAELEGDDADEPGLFDRVKNIFNR
jgi:molecular chaperone DnaJ